MSIPEALTTDAPTATEVAVDAPVVPDSTPISEADLAAIQAALSEEPSAEHPVELTPEELEAKKRRLETIADERRAQRIIEAKKTELEREKKRIEDGKALARAKDEREAYMRQKALDERRATQLADKVARAAIMAKVDQDRRERAAQAAAAGVVFDDAAAAPVPTETPALAVNAPRGLYRLKEEDDAARRAAEAAETKERIECLITLFTTAPDASDILQGFHRIVNNLILNPTEEKFRRLPKIARLVARLAAADGGEEFLQLIGFNPKEDAYVMEKVPFGRLVHIRTTLEGAASRLSA